MIRNRTTFLPLALIAACLLLFPLLSFASEATYEKHLAKGLADMESNELKSAIQEFRAALEDEPDSSSATLYLGIALSRSGDKEAEGVLKKAVSMSPSDARANLELGVYYYNVSKPKEALEYLQKAEELGRGSDLSEKAAQYISRIKGTGAARNWALSLSLGGQYDTNVVLNAEGSPLKAGISHKSDWRAVAYLNGRYNMVTNDKIESSVGYNLYQSVHTKLDDFNISQHILDLTATYHLTPALSVRGMYAFEYDFVGGGEYELAHTLTPALLFSEGRGFKTALEYRYRKEHFRDVGLFTDNHERTGADNLVEVSQTVPISGFVTAKAAYSYDVDSTAVDFWHYTGNRVTLGFIFTLPRRMVLNLDGEYYNKDYKGTKPSFPDPRRDRLYSGSVALTKALCDRYSVTAGQTYERNKSNITDFDYKRAVTSLFLNVRF